MATGTRRVLVVVGATRRTSRQRGDRGAADGRLEAFGTNSAHNVYHQWQLTPGGTWSGWAVFDGGLSDVAAETNADGRIELFGVTANGAIFHRSQVAPGAAWSPWAHLSGVLTNLAVARNGDGPLEMFGTDAVAFRLPQTTDARGGNDWSAWSRFDGALSHLAAETNADGRVEVFGTETDGAISHRWQLTPAGAWSGLAAHGGRIAVVGRIS